MLKAIVQHHHVGTEVTTREHTRIGAPGCDDDGSIEPAGEHEVLVADHGGIERGGRLAIRRASGHGRLAGFPAVAA